MYVEVVPKSEVKNLVFVTSGTSWYQWQTRRQSERMAFQYIYLFMWSFNRFNVMILLEPFSREIQVNQAREGRMDGQDSQESLGFLGKR